MWGQGVAVLRQLAAGEVGERVPLGFGKIDQHSSETVKPASSFPEDRLLIGASGQIRTDIISLED